MVAYSDEVAALICQKIANGQSLREICSADEMPDKATVLRWLGEERHTAFRDQYAHAREAQADHFADEILEIADDGTNDWMERIEADLRQAIPHCHVISHLEPLEDPRSMDDEVLFRS